MMEPQGERVGEPELLNNLLTCLQCRTSAQLSCKKRGKRFTGGIMQNYHGSKPRKIRVTACENIAGTGSSVLDPFPSVVLASLRAVDHRCCTPLHLWKKEPLGTGIDTHTAPLCGARANDLNRHLKSLRNKRKKHRKSSAKRA